MFAGGLHDAAAVLAADWEPSSGHWPEDPFGERRVDAVRVSTEVAPALQGIQVTRTDLTLTASDHLPVTVTFDTDQITPA